MTVVEQETSKTVVPMVTLPASVLRDALHVHIAAGRDDTLPTLTGVQVSWSEGEPITFAATDRYRLAVATVEKGNGHGLTLAVGEGSFLLPRKDAIDLVKQLPKPKKRDTGAVPVSVTQTKGYVTFHWVHEGSTVSAEFRTLEGQFPKWQSLIPTEAKPVERTAYNPAYMADVAKLPSASNHPVKWMFSGESRPALAHWDHAGIAWQYLLMPVRLYS